MAKLPQVQYEFSARGEQRYQQLGNELNGMLRLEAVAWAKRRLSKTVDESDVEHGFREMVGQRKVGFARQTISAILYVVAGGITSWAVNAYGNGESANGHWAALIALACAGVAAFIQYWPGWR